MEKVVVIGTSSVVVVLVLSVGTDVSHGMSDARKRQAKAARCGTERARRHCCAAIEETPLKREAA